MTADIAVRSLQPKNQWGVDAAYPMSDTFEGLSAKEANHLMQGLVGCLVCETLDEARRMTPDELRDRDIFEWSHYVAGLIAVIVHNRRRDAP